MVLLILVDRKRIFRLSILGGVVLAFVLWGSGLGKLFWGAVSLVKADTPQQATGKVYAVSSFGSGGMLVIDAVTNTFQSTINVSDGAQSVALSADGTRLYVSNGASKLSAIDTASSSVVGTVTVGSETSTTYSLAVNPAGTRVYVAINGGETGDSVDVVDVSTNAVIARVPRGEGRAGRVAVSPNGNRVYTANSDNYAQVTLSVIDAVNNQLISTLPVSLPTCIPVSGMPSMTQNLSGSRLYITVPCDDSVVVVDTAANTIVQRIGVGSAPQGVAISPDGLRLYTSNWGAGEGSTGGAGNTVSVVDVSTGVVINTIPIVAGGSGIVFQPNGSAFYVTNTFTNTVTVIDPRRDAVVAIVGVGRWPADVVVKP